MKEFSGFLAAHPEALEKAAKVASLHNLRYESFGDVFDTNSLDIAAAIRALIPKESPK